MSSLTLIVFDTLHRDLIEAAAGNQAVTQVLLVRSARAQPEDMTASQPAAGIGSRTFDFRVLNLDRPLGADFQSAITEIKTDYALVVLPGSRVSPGQRAIERFVSVAQDSGSALVYSDFKENADRQMTDHPLIDYQAGSIRDNFDFGSVLLISREAAARALRLYGRTPQGTEWGGLYDLRLKLSIESAAQAGQPALRRIPESLYSRETGDSGAPGERQFDYVDPRHRDYQIEMEEIAGAHLRRIGAYLDPVFDSLPETSDSFPVLASVVIPVRNRERTIADAVRSALSQKTSFSFNVIVVDNHSTDRTTEILAALAQEDRRLIHLVPSGADLGIGGCWNEAIFSQACGKYAVQLDSDDLYAGDNALKQIVDKFSEGPFAMVIGAYTIVDFELNEMPPGLIDHREWTRENGRNNALRINGLGAPRAFYVPVLRRFGFPDVSYGEDYAVALRISRQYEVGRIYESLYYARRWSGNSDAALSLAAANRYDHYKDFLRTAEIEARQRMNRK
jgi:Glycosyl transferase family 2